MVRVGIGIAVALAIYFAALTWLGNALEHAVGR